MIASETGIEFKLSLLRYGYSKYNGLKKIRETDMIMVMKVIAN